MARRRSFSVFNLSFLDVMSCGLGAVVLFFMVINAQISSRAGRANQALQAEADRLEEEVLDGRKDLVRIRNSLETRTEAQRSAEAELAALTLTLETLRAELAEFSDSTVAREQSPEALRADIERLEAAKRRLAEQGADTAPRTGERVRSFVGDGNRQYLTGMQMGGRRVLILVDASASMLARSYINVLRFRSLEDDRKRLAPKWRQVVDSVDWLTTQIQPGTQFQLYVFNRDADSVLPDSDGRWIEVTDGTELDRAVTALREVVPGDGTSLYQAFRAAAALEPSPDNIFLLTDGLPTQGRSAPDKAEPVKAERRVEYFNQAARELPSRVPVNVLLFPMDGDPAAPGLYWQLALSTRGSLLTPSRDWP